MNGWKYLQIINRLLLFFANLKNLLCVVDCRLGKSSRNKEFFNSKKLVRSKFPAIVVN